MGRSSVVGVPLSLQAVITTIAIIITFFFSSPSTSFTD
jgi:hypothetical protein